ncbi:MAG: HaeIII family restriction endonuclease [Muribaculaceae bacterium]|nr:HaeIII family restriction endonuclease [Muribaculaceae bacterium]
MASSGKQVKNGKAFEYAIARTYYDYISSMGIPVEWVESDALRIAKSFYDTFQDSDKQRFDNAAYNTISSLVKIEPGLITPGKKDDVLKIALNSDASGEVGDVRDVVFSHVNPSWEIGFSAKNNNDAVKHSRLGKDLDFGKVWLGYACSSTYWNDIKPIFSLIESHIAQGYTWNDLGASKEKDIYLPILKAFRKELLRICSEYSDVPKKLIKYLIGTNPFYKIIKDDKHNMVVVKAFNIKGKLNKSYMGCKSAYRVPKINYPTRMVELEFKQNSNNTLNMILDGGWEISFRIHSASRKVERSLKFDINLLGNPPILFTQYIFQ